MWKLLVYDVITFSGVSRLFEARAGLLVSPPHTGKRPQDNLFEWARYCLTGGVYGRGSEEIFWRGDASNNVF